MKDYLHGFQVITGANVRWVRKIWEFFDDFQWAWEKAGIRDFVDAGLSVKSAEKLFFERGKIVLEREIENLYSKKISLVSCFEKSYPEMLRDIEDRPFLLYVLGDYEKVFQRRMISIVGSRMPSEYGREMTYVLSEKILDGGAVPVSGLAYGVDGFVHQACVDREVATVAVLGGGVDFISPASHGFLAQSILDNDGVIMSEYPPGFVSMKHHFLQRNRIIAGLSEATIITEARIRSGALSTANHALRYGRKVYVLGGDITRPQGKGGLELLVEKRAVPIFSIEQFLEDLKLKKSEVFELSFFEEQVYQCFGKRSLSFEELVVRVPIQIHELQTGLALLEIKGLILRETNGSFRKK